jgi:hypothetical protein
VTSFRWTEGNLRGLEDMWKKDMFNLLYGTAPIWMFRGDGRSLAIDDPGRLAETYSRVCAVNEYTAFDEMLSHALLPATQGNVQRTTWESGLQITVNFSDTTSYSVEGSLLGPAQYLLEGDPATYPTLPLGVPQQMPYTWQRPTEAANPVYNGSFGNTVPVSPFLKVGVLASAHESSDGFNDAHSMRIDGMGPDFGGPNPCGSGPYDSGVNGKLLCELPVGALEPGADYAISARIKLLQDTGDPNGLDHPSLKLVHMVDPQNGNKLVWIGGTSPTGSPQSIIWGPNLVQGQWSPGTQRMFRIPANTVYSFVWASTEQDDVGGCEFLLDDLTIVKQ